ncbi:MAG TPA: type II secretion system F family protein, partial [Gemmatimonadales bacterium]|nr:type II secretion system F family protein [Gemmatimonadales bacterium]
LVGQQPAAMSAYSYRAARQDGAIVTGAIEADSYGQASATLASRGLFPIAVAEAAEAHRAAASRRDLAIVFRGIAALVSSGVPLERAVAASEPLASGPLRQTLATARERLREGASFANALAMGRGVVPGLVIGMVRAGERGSQLGTALDQVAAHLEQEADLVGRVRQALTYPLFLAVAGVASVLVITTVVVPRFAAILGDLGQQLPPATRVLLGTSQFLSRFWIPLLLVTVAATWSAIEWVRRPAGRKRLEEALLRIPFIGSVRRALATARVMRALGGMLRAGMPLLPALDAAREAAGDLAIAERLARSRERVMQGAPLALALEREAALTPSALQLMMVGESSGRVAEMALGAGNLAAQEAERGLRALVTALEPALIVAFGGLVAFTAAALLQAVYSLRPGV